MSRSADTRFSSLKDFQRDTVAYVLRRLYEDRDRVDRFLVADEVGMGKTLVARGVIAGAIEKLENDAGVGRIDIIYICSNADIARQNISKLSVGNGDSRSMSSRLTLLATQLRDLDRPSDDGRKKVNLVAFTPGTSFDQGSHRGHMNERALLAWMLRPIFERDHADYRRLCRVLRMGVMEQRWNGALKKLQDEPPDAKVAARFRAEVQGVRHLGEIRAVLAETAGRSIAGKDLGKRCRTLIANLRHLLARVSVECLEPDLVILDEFQRFKHLLERPEEGDEFEISQIAHHLFEAKTAKVLLLSATPYRMFTLPEERELSGDDHYGDFLATVGFLAWPRHKEIVTRLESALRDFRRRAVSGDDPKHAKEEVEVLLKQVMSRTERPVSDRDDMLDERDSACRPPTPQDMVGYVAMQRLASEIGGTLSVEYWKSAPYFLNFMDGYQLSEKFRSHSFEPSQRTRLLTHAQVIRGRDRRSPVEIDPGNARLRALKNDTLDRGLWKLLWLPPSMPYSTPAAAYADVDATSATKRLIFSSWAAAPSAIASLLSWAAAQRMGTGLDELSGHSRPRLVYRIDEGRPAGMSALALFVPTPKLADVTDPLGFARTAPDELLASDRMIALAVERSRSLIPPAGTAKSELSRETWYWAAPFAIDRSEDWPDLAQAITEGQPSTEDKGLSAHLEEATRAARREFELSDYPADLERWVALIGLAGPANVAWRALKRVTAKASIREEALVRAAATIAAGFRSLFNRPEVMTLLDSQARSGLAYWQVVLEYCHAGNLQAVVDEYVHHLVGNENPSTDEEILDLARRIRTVIGLRTGTLQAFDPTHPATPLRFPTRFALRYGSAKGTAKADEGSIDRMSDVQAAFNSPFWPMVLASTSIGQEGVDFHWWCHSIVHWNLPTNPVDFEQREGRIHRFKGHAVRKNVAADHRARALRSEESDPWVAAFAEAEKSRPLHLDELWPWWVYRGAARIERWVLSMPLSREVEKERLLQRRRALYRLAFGQPRQDDLLTILDQEGYAVDDARLKELRINLRPPSAPEVLPAEELVP
jgi:hypothetical protein